MNKDIGLWIDHRIAVVVIVSEEGEEFKEIQSDLEKHVRFSDSGSEDSPAEDVRDRHFGKHLRTSPGLVRNSTSLRRF